MRANRGVADGIRGQLLVGNHEPGVVLGANEGVHQGDFLDRPLEAADLDPIADPQRLRHRDHQPGDDVSERSLGGEPDDQAQHRRGREQTARDRAHLGNHEERREQPDRHDPGRDRPAQDAIARHRLRRLVGAHDPSIDQPRGDERRDEHDHNHEQALPPLHGFGIRQPHVRPYHPHLVETPYAEQGKEGWRLAAWSSLVLLLIVLGYGGRLQKETRRRTPSTGTRRRSAPSSSTASSS
jgi:hypothetical protein